METSVILNIVFIGLVGLGFICYQIWVGFKLVKTNEKLRETISKIEKNSNYHDEISKVLELNSNQGDEELRKTIDRLDSRLDGKSKEIYDNLDTSINNINNRMDESLNVVHSRLDENLDKLKSV